MTSEMELVVGVDGGVRCIYDEALDLREIGRLSITRAQAQARRHGARHRERRQAARGGGWQDCA